MEWNGGWRTIIEEVWSKCNQVQIENWNSKSGSNTNSKFKVNVRALSKVKFGQTIYCFEYSEVKIPKLQMVPK